MTLRVVLIRRFLGLHHEKTIIQGFLTFFPDTFSSKLLFFEHIALLRGDIPAVWGFRGSCFASATWLVFLLSDLIATMPYTRVTYKPRDLKTACFQNGGHMSEQKKIVVNSSLLIESKFLQILIIQCIKKP